MSYGNSRTATKHQKKMDSQRQPSFETATHHAPRYNKDDQDNKGDDKKQKQKQICRSKWRTWEEEEEEEEKKKKKKVIVRRYRRRWPT